MCFSESWDSDEACQVFRETLIKASAFSYVVVIFVDYWSNINLGV
jgi:hypothetical protein